jgi:thioredoxin reductase
LKPLPPYLYLGAPHRPAYLREEHRITSRSQKRIAVIGAGVAGLVSAKVLREDGFEVSVFEQESTVGGVWAESRAYPGLRTNNPRETYAFSDFEYPPSADAFPTAGQVREYLEAYADRFGVGPHIHLNTEVLSVARRAPRPEGGHPGFRVMVRPVGGDGGLRPHRLQSHDPEADEPKRHDVDFVVVCSGVFSVPSTPEIEGRERFEGLVLHSSQLTDPERVRGMRVVVVGAGKSALDCATAAAEEATSATLVFRRPQMVPEVPVTAGIENNGIGTEFYDVLREGRVGIRRGGVTSYVGPDRIRLDTGEELEADVVVFATGWRQTVSLLEFDLRRDVQRDGWFHL